MNKKNNYFFIFFLKNNFFLISYERNQIKLGGNFVAKKERMVDFMKNQKGSKKKEILFGGENIKRLFI